jgi:RNA polymerase sigma-70 factor, ECF subfamily
MLMQDDRSLLQRVAAGTADSTAALEALYVRHRRPLLMFLRRRGAAHTDAEDVVQEVFIRVIKKAEQFKGGSEVSTWLHTIALRLYLDRLQLQPQLRGVQPSDSDEWDLSNIPIVDPAPEAAVCIDRKAFERCYAQQYRLFANANPAMHEALELVLRGVNGRELAALMRRTEGAARQFLLVCRQRLREFLAPCGDHYRAQAD